MKNNSNKEQEKKETKNIKSSLFKIEENKELINSLHLTHFKFTIQIININFYFF